MQGSKMAWLITALLGVIVVGVIAFVLVKGSSTDRQQRVPQAGGPQVAGQSAAAQQTGRTPTVVSPVKPIPTAGTKPPVKVARPKIDYRPPRSVSRDEWINKSIVAKGGISEQRVQENKEVFEELGQIHEKYKDVIDVIAASQQEAAKAAEIDDPNAEIKEPATDARKQMAGQEMALLVEEMRALDRLRQKLPENEQGPLGATIAELYQRYEGLKKAE